MSKYVPLFILWEINVFAPLATQRIFTDFFLLYSLCILVVYIYKQSNVKRQKE